MRIRHIVVVGSASLTLISVPCRFACADNTNQNPSSPAASSQGQSGLRFNAYRFALPRLDEKPSGGVAHRNNESSSLQNKSAQQNENGPSTGLHWTTVDSHPAVGYQIDKNEDVHLHFGRHGATANFALRF